MRRIEAENMRSKTKKTSLIACLVAGLLVGMYGSAQSSPTPAPSFREALEVHLTAVRARDMEALLPTLTGGDDLTMIAPNGNKLDTKQQYLDFHRQWFVTNDDGRFNFEIVRVIESPALAHALVRYRYSSKDNAENAQANVSWLALTFALENGSWRLVFDQNTRIEAQAER
jgi:ketosteroid isomerase-like protein